MNKLWEESAYSKTRPKSYIFLTKPNTVQETILAKRGIVPLVSDKDNPGDALEDFLSDLFDKARGL